MIQLAAAIPPPHSAPPAADPHAGTQAHTAADAGHHGNSAYWENLGTVPLILNILPFVALLLMIAILPLLPKVDHWWHHNKNKLMVAGICGALGILLYLIPTGDWHKIVHTYAEYLAFMMLLASLFIISGGIHISGPFAGFPHINTLFLALGAILANLMGTTGASMLLIRPLLTANKPRAHKTHIVVFFIFIVSNCGGLLTPLGDPPLYLGFLRGVPFNWTLRLFPEWITVIGGLLLIFMMLDSFMFTKEELATKESLTHLVQAKADGRKLRIDGAFNLGFLALIIGTILASGYIVHPLLKAQFGLSNADLFASLFQAGTMGLIAFVSYRMTQPKIREDNQFSFEPIFEVACLFVGIFGAMIPALTLLEAKSASLALTAPWQYFWTSGILSGFLDNAPTYLTFVTLAAGKSGLPSSPLTEFVIAHPHLLAAISCGSVFMGALSYIGNGPNFMVKAIAEHANVKMPSFGGYMLWSFTFLVPFFILVTFLFFLH